jgi:outer membrane protein
MALMVCLMPVGAWAQSPAAGDALLSLQEAERLALEHHPALGRARAEQAGSEAAIMGARAPLLPQVQGQASWLYQGRPGVQFSGPVRVESQTYNVGLSVDQLITDFGRTTGRLRAAQANAQASRFNERDVEAQVLADVRQAYFVGAARAALRDVAARTLENQQRHLEQVEAFVELGERPPYDLAQARTNVGVARADRASAEGNLRIAKAQLVQAMGVARTTDFELEDTEFPKVAGEDATPEALLPEAWAARPDLAALEERIRAQRAIVSSQRAGYWPSIGVGAGINEVGTSLDDLGTNWVAGANLTWPLFQGGATRAAVAEAEANVVALESDRERLAQAVRFEREQSLAAIETAMATRAAAEETVASAQEQLRLAEGRYEAGLGSLLELSDAEIALQRAEASRVQAGYDLGAARAQLIERLGRR